MPRTPNPIRLSTRVRYLSVVWCIALLAAWAVTWPNPHPVMVFAVIVFPSGLFEFVKPDAGDSAWVIVLAWLAYVALTAVVVRAHRRKTYAIAFVGLCVLLLLNVAGCGYHMAHVHLVG